jgi:hypothetical protein
MKRFFISTAMVIALFGCATPAPAPQATYTPLPTYTPYPTFTPLISGNIPTARPISTATPRSASFAQPQATTASVSCISWKDAAMHLNETTCVTGIVTSATQNGSTFFINFDNSRTSFYAVSFKYTWDNLKGKCVELHGKIVPYNGRPEIVIERQEQVRMCAD